MAADRLQVLQDFARRVRELRAGLGISQSALSEIASMDPTYVGMVERAEVNMGLVTIANLATAFGLTLSELFQYTEDKNHE